MNRNLEKFLRDHCNLIDWNPTQQQLEAIKKDIDAAIASGKILSRTECQHIVVKHCGSTKMFLTKGADNSDLNALLAMAVKQDSSND